MDNQRTGCIVSVIMAERDRAKQAELIVRFGPHLSGRQWQKMYEIHRGKVYGNR
jgi:hypothetical protein